MTAPRILVVDDEKNIRLTVPRALESLTESVETAVNGEEALTKLEQAPFDVVFLDLKLPGMDGMEVLRTIEATWPRTRVIIITAHGSVESAVEALKLGAVDYLQKPFSPDEIREAATSVLERDALDEDEAAGYAALVELAKRHMTNRDVEAARDAARKAIAADPERPEAYNLTAALLEVDGDRDEAAKLYRAALDIDPTFAPASANLERLGKHGSAGRIDLGPRLAPPKGGDGR